jgi:pimeloyl-ACP methyl ester carboxylesterase
LNRITDPPIVDEQKGTSGTMKSATFLFIVTIVLTLMISGAARASSSQTENITFQIAQFEISSDLRVPEGEGPHPAIIVVHGDGGGTRNYYRTMKSRFATAGYAVLIWDKPGFGSSTGKFTGGELMSERATILLEAIATLRKRPDIDPARIGVWGVSQAGWVIPLALQRDADIAFMILVGAGGESGVQQTAYYIGQQIQCTGFTADQAAEADSLAAGVMAAETYDEYVANGRDLLDSYPLVKEIDFMAGVLPEDRWIPRPPDSESFFDPMTVIEKTAIPTLVFYGELDKNVDPVQGAAAYQAAFEKTGNKHSRVIVLPGVDHDMVPCKTGCEEERNNRSNWKPDSRYLGGMSLWLGAIAD